MSTADSKSSSSPTFSGAREDHFEPYRAISRAAIGSLVFALLGLLGILFPVMLTLPAMASVLGVVAIANLRKYPNELTGWAPACMGLVLGVGVVVGGTARHSYIYATEVPDGCKRIWFSMLQPDPQQPQVPVPDEAIALDNERVFVKGYMHPGVANMGKVQEFILVPDMGTCCFGGQPKLTDMIEVKLEGSLAIEYARRKRKLGGTFKVDSELKPVTGLGGVYYQLSADYLK